jgi:hypothetical protein
VPDTPAPESAEVFEVSWVPFAQALSWATEGTISDGKTLIGLYRAHSRRAA